MPNGNVKSRIILARQQVCAKHAQQGNIGMVQNVQAVTLPDSQIVPHHLIGVLINAGVIVKTTRLAGSRHLKLSVVLVDHAPPRRSEPRIQLKLNSREMPIIP